METLNISLKDKYAICEIDNGKVNAIDTALSRDLKQFFNEAEADDGIEGVILTGRPHCFSAGLNVMKLMSGGKEGLEEFWSTQIDAIQSMVRFSKPYIAAVTGYAPAAGTVLACTADYRIMGRGEKHVIGMHEFKLSLVIPDIYIQVFSHWIGEKNAMECILHSKLMHADEAQKIGLVNEVCEVEEVLPRAEALMQKWTSQYVKSNQMTKSFLNKSFIAKVDLDKQKMINDIISNAFDPKVVAYFAQFANSIKKKA